ncbi:MAG: nitrogen fixation protein NifH [Chloroflexota bacterium]
MSDWRNVLGGADPLPWLLEESNPAVRRLALLHLLDRPADDPEAVAAGTAAMASGPIATILANQAPEGYWAKPGPGYSPKYTSTVWQIMFLEELGADGSDARVSAGCEYLLNHCQTTFGGFGAAYAVRGGAPPPAAAIHCLNGNLLRALIGFGLLDDERVQRAVEWQARAITGEGFDHYYASTTCAPGFACAANDKLPCAWGAVKAVLALAAIPEGARSGAVQHALAAGVDFLLSRDPAQADYPMPARANKPNESWFKLGFPHGYVADVLQNVEALCALGLARDPRLAPALAWLLAKQSEPGRWKNQYAYPGKMWIDIEPQGAPSKWVTLRACRVLKAAYG